MHPRFAGLWLIFSAVLLSSAVLAQSCRGGIVSYPPSVSIVAPSTMTITRSAIFAASCADPVGCKQIVFAVDGVTIATIKAEPFTASFDTTVLLDVNNPHTLTARATNTFGLLATNRTSFTTNNGTTPAARTFYIATSGKDANPGTAAQPWATPNYALRCGDTIVLQPGTYTNPFANWGHVWSCPSASGYYFANLVCNGPYVQSCLFTNSVAGTSIMVVNSSNWLVRGVTAVNNVQYGGCFSGWTAGVAYIAFANVYAKNCGAGTGTSGQDYVAYVGSLFYGGAGLGGQCFSNLSIFQPKNFDSQSGTHVFIGGSFFINASNSLNCTDGEGLIFDRWDINHYTGQGVVEQSLFIGNCSEAWEVLGSYGGPLYFTQSTTWSNGKTCNSGSGGGSEILLSFYRFGLLRNDRPRYCRRHRCVGWALERQDARQLPVLHRPQFVLLTGDAEQQLHLEQRRAAVRPGQGRPIPADPDQHHECRSRVRIANAGNHGTRLQYSCHRVGLRCCYPR
jgi:hypothetical protein